MSVINRRRCSSAEIWELKEYLSQTPVWRIVEEIRSDDQVSKGELTGVNEIGTLRTMWGCLGGIRSIDEYGTDKFLVSQVMKTLANPQCTDKQLHNKIVRYMQLFDDHRLQLKITLVEDKSGVMICDGDSRVVACYEWALKHNHPDISLPVYVVAL